MLWAQTLMLVNQFLKEAGFTIQVCIIMQNKKKSTLQHKALKRLRGRTVSWLSLTCTTLDTGDFGTSVWLRDYRPSGGCMSPAGHQSLITGSTAHATTESRIR